MGQMCCCFRARNSETTTARNESSGSALDTNLKPPHVEESCHTSKVASSEDNADEAIDVQKGMHTGPKPGKSITESAVLVELFTSQGCSSCPSADSFISRLGRGEGEDVTKLVTVPILVLSYHVDYWDYLGWKDPFASSTYTVRQRAYGQALQQDTIFTPEVVVQGRSQCIGSDMQSVLDLIQAAPRFAPPDVHTSFAWPTSSTLQVSIRISLKFKVDSFTLDVMLAICENGLVTDCQKGENRGRVLTNDFVVRGLQKVCSLKDVPSKKSVKGEATFELWQGYRSSKCALVLFLQNPITQEAYGALSLPLPDAPL